jgi:vacuolar-type H+-ATPase subunit H
MPVLPLLIFNAIASLGILIFISYYFLQLRVKEKHLDKEIIRVDSDYHKMIDGALSKERKILEDATAEADQIITGARHISLSVRDEVNSAMQVMVAGIQKDAFSAAKNFAVGYQKSLQDLAGQSMNDFKNIVKALEEDLQKQVKEFHEVLLPGLEKELEDYKQARLARLDKTVEMIVNKASLEIVNKSFSAEDHKNLVIESLEKAKKEGTFD